MPTVTVGARAASEPPWEDAELCHAPGSGAPMGDLLLPGRCIAGEARPPKAGPYLRAQGGPVGAQGGPRSTPAHVLRASQTRPRSSSPPPWA